MDNVNVEELIIQEGILLKGGVVPRGGNFRGGCSVAAGGCVTKMRMSPCRAHKHFFCRYGHSTGR